MRALIGLMVVAPIVSSCLAIHVHDRPLAELEAERIATPYTKLPAGSIEPRGWLRKQLELQAAGFHGRLTEISPFLRRDGNAWLAKDGQGERGWEEVPYWLKGYIGCAFALNDPKMIAEARVWIDGAIASQDASGMFGPRGKGAASTVQSTSGPLDLWSNMVMLNCLQTWHEATGDARVLELMRKYFAFELTIPDDQFLPPYWQQQRAADNLASVLWLYERTPDPQLLELAKKIHRHTANWTDGIPDWHNVNMAQAFGGPATYWRVSRDRKHLDAAERNFRTIRETYGQVPGGMFGGDENCRPGFADPRQAIETCGMVEMMLSCERLFAIIGDAVWAERCEGRRLQLAARGVHAGLLGPALPDVAEHGPVGRIAESARIAERRQHARDAVRRPPLLPTQRRARLAVLLRARLDGDAGRRARARVPGRVAREDEGAGRPRRRDRRRIALPVRAARSDCA
jgi:hypothetical protein